MSPRTVDAVITMVLNHEGGLSDHPLDHGGLTNFGLTKPFLKEITGREWPDQEIRDLTRDKARAVYLHWLRVRRLIHVPDDVRVAHAIIDYAIHSGARTAIKATQTVMGIPSDGIAGPQTQGHWGSLDEAGVEDLRLGVLAIRLRHFARIVQRDPSQAVFLAGWLNRVADLVGE